MSLNIIGFKKAMLLSGTIAVVVGCSSGRNDEEASVMNVNFEGTWRVLKERQYYSERFNEYLYSQLSESRLYFRADDSKANSYVVDSCESFYVESIFRSAEVKESGLIIEDEPAEFRLTDLNELQSKFSYEWKSNDEDVRVIDIVALQKESNEFLLDSGSIMLNSPSDFYEDEHVCFERLYSNNSPEQSIWLANGIGGEQIRIGVVLNDSLDSSSYRSKEEFWLQRKKASVTLYAGIYAPAEKNLELDIIQSEKSVFRGDFEFEDQHSSNFFSGQLEVLF